MRGAGTQSCLYFTGPSWKKRHSRTAGTPRAQGRSYGITGAMCLIWPAVEGPCTLRAQGRAPHCRKARICHHRETRDQSVLPYVLLDSGPEPSIQWISALHPLSQAGITHMAQMEN